MQLTTDKATGDNSLNRFAVVIPVYNHDRTIVNVVHRTLKLGVPVIVVDDGSTDATYNRISAIESVRVLRHRRNRGKGAALITGFEYAVKFSDWVITLDADGQHDPEDAKTLIGAIPITQRSIVIGNRMGMTGAHVPWTSRFGRKFSNFWVHAAGGPEVEDSQSGFRVYPLPECLNLDVRSRRFQFEIEILVKAWWNNIPVVEAPVRVSYRPGTPRISHFHPFFDFLRNFGVFSRLITYRILMLRFLRG